MDTSSINNAINNALYNSPLLSNTNKNEESLVEQMKNQKNKSEEIKEAMLSPGRRMSRAASNASEAIAELQAKGISINKESIAAEVKQRESDFQVLVSGYLKALGVDEEIEFKVALDGNGKIIVNTSHGDKDKVQQFFDNNPELSDEFKNIESLKNLQKSMETNQSMNQADIRRNIQLENLDAFFQGMDSGNDTGTPLIMAYGKNSILALAGVNLNV